MEVEVEWMNVRDMVATSEVDINRSLETTGPGSAQLLDTTRMSGTIVVQCVLIVPLVLIHPLMNSTLLFLANALNLMEVRASTMGIELRVTPFWKWL